MGDVDETEQAKRNVWQAYRLALDAARALDDRPLAMAADRLAQLYQQRWGAEPPSASKAMSQHTDILSRLERIEALIAELSETVTES